MAHRHSLTARLAGQPPAIGNRHGLYRLFELRIRSASVCARVAAGPIVAGFRIGTVASWPPKLRRPAVECRPDQAHGIGGMRKTSGAPIYTDFVNGEPRTMGRHQMGCRDAERAVRAALEIVHTVAGLVAEDLSVGIATGPVVVVNTVGCLCRYMQ